MTKRQLGILFLVAGGAALVSLGLVDVIGAGRFGGVGPLQKGALMAAGLLVVVGLTLLPLGDRPA